MMDKKEIEKYIKLYPRIDEEIKSLEDDLKFYEDKISDYENRTALSKIDTDSYEAAKEGLSEKKKQLNLHFKLRIAIMRALSKMEFQNRKIIELRFWNGPVAKWDKVAKETSMSKSKAEKLYAEFLESIKQIIK